MLSGNTLPPVSKWSIFVTGLPWPLTARWCGNEKAIICWHLYLETTLRQCWQQHLSGVTERGCARTVGQVRKTTNTRPVLAWRVDLFLNLSLSVKWCWSDLDGDCRLASLQCCRETGGEARVPYGNVISVFLSGDPTFLYSSALEGWVLSYCKWL